MEVARYTMSVLNLVLESSRKLWAEPTSTGRLVVRSVCLVICLLCSLCACEEILRMMYPMELQRAAHPFPLFKLVTPTVTPTLPGDDKTSGIASDQDGDSASWSSRRRRAGLLASICDADCILIYGSQPSRLNKKVCKRAGGS